MSFQGDRLDIFPSRANLNDVNIRLKNTQTGLRLLKMKKKAFQYKLNKLSASIVKAKTESNDKCLDASKELFKAKLVTPLLNETVLAAVKSPSITVERREEQVLGMALTSFGIVESSSQGDAGEDYTGLGRGGESVTKAKNSYADVLKDLTELASMQTQFLEVEKELKKMNGRVNVLKYRIIPRFENTIKYIEEALEEQEMEELYRRKLVLKKKEKEVQRKEQLRNKSVDVKLKEPVSDILGAWSDPDILF